MVSGRQDGSGSKRDYSSPSIDWLALIGAPSCWKVSGSSFTSFSSSCPILFTCAFQEVEISPEVLRQIWARGLWTVEEAPPQLMDQHFRFDVWGLERLVRIHPPDPHMVVFMDGRYQLRLGLPVWIELGTAFRDGGGFSDVKEVHLPLLQIRRLHLLPWAPFLE